MRGQLQILLILCQTRRKISARQGGLHIRQGLGNGFRRALRRFGGRSGQRGRSYQQGKSYDAGQEVFSKHLEGKSKVHLVSLVVAQSVAIVTIAP